MAEWLSQNSGIGSDDTHWYALYAVLTRLLSPAWGAMGAAIAFSATEIVFHPLLFWIYGGVHGYLKYGKIFPEIAIGAAFLGTMWFCAGRSLGAAIACVLVYGILWRYRNRKTLKLVKQEINFARGCASGEGVKEWLLR